jgi:hypothetical protein
LLCLASGVFDLERCHILLQCLEHRFGVPITSQGCAAKPHIGTHVITREAIAETVEVKLANGEQGLSVAGFRGAPAPIERFGVIAWDTDGFTVHDAKPILRFGMPALGGLRVPVSGMHEVAFNSLALVISPRNTRG